MDMDRRWALSLISVMFLTTTSVQCQNSTITNSTTNQNSTTGLEDIVPGSLKMGSDNMFEAPQIFGGQPFTIKTDPVTGQVDFQTKTVNVQAVNEARDRDEAQKVAELHEDMLSRVPSAAHLPLEAKDDEYSDLWLEPIKRADTEYYDEEPVESREPIMVSNKGGAQRPPVTTPKEEDSFMSIFESLFGGGEEEKKQEMTEPPKVYRDRYTTAPTFTPEIRRPVEHPMTTRRPESTPVRTTTEYRRVYQQLPEKQHTNQFNSDNQYEQYQNDRYNSYQTNRPHTPPPGRPGNYQQTPSDRPNPYNQQYTSPPTSHYRPRPPTEQPFQIMPDRQNVYQQPPERFSASHKSERPQPPPTTPPTTTTSTTTSTTTTTTTTPRPTTSNNDWQSFETNNLGQPIRGNIDRQDTYQNEIKESQNSPDYYNFISSLPAHYSTKDTAIPLISGSYANTKIQGMGASKFETNNGKYSNHKYDSTSTSKRPSYWSTKRPSTTKPTSITQMVDFGSLETDEGAIGFSADFGGYGQKAGVMMPQEKEKISTRPPQQTPPPTRSTSIRITSSSTTPTTTTVKATTTTRFTPPKTTPTRPAPVREYEDYEYDSYPAQVKPVANPVTPKRPESVTKLQLSTTTTTTTNRPPPPKEPEYEYYDYEAESTTPTTTTTTTTTTTPKPTTTTTTTTSKYKLRYPSLSKDRIRRPDEKVEVVVPVQTEPTTTTTTKKIQTSPPIQRPTKPRPAPVFEDSDIAPSMSIPSNSDQFDSDGRPSVISMKDTDNNGNVELVPAKVSPNTPRQPINRQPSQEYTTEFTVGAVQGQDNYPGLQGGHSEGHQSGNQGHFIASSIAASPFDGPDEPFRPIARPPGMSTSFQVAGDDDLERPASKPAAPFYQPAEPDVHEPHEFIPSPQFHRPENDLFVVGTSFNTKPGAKPTNPYVKPEYFQQPPRKPETVKVQPPRPSAYPNTESGFLKPPNFVNQRPEQSDINIHHPSPIPTKEEEYYKPTNKPNYYSPKPGNSEEDYGSFEQEENKKAQSDVQLSEDYDFDGIQTEPKPGQYVIFHKPQINSEINENQIKKATNPALSQFQSKPVTEAQKFQESTTIVVPSSERPFDKPEVEKQQEMASNYPRPHWEKNGKPSFMANPNQNRPPFPPPHMSSNLIPPGNAPPRYRRPIAPPNMPPVRKNFNEGNYQQKPKPNLPNILPQFRPNAKIGNPQRPYRLPPNRRKENFPYRIQTEPDPLMHRDFEVEDDIMPKYITNRAKPQDYEPMMMHKRFGVPPPSPPPRRVQRTPVTTLQMLQQTHGIKKQHMPSTREDQPEPTMPLIPPMYKPFTDEKKDVYLVYPVKTPFNSNIKIEDPDKIDYSFNQTHDQVPLLKPSRKKDKLKPEFPYGFVTPDENVEELRREVKPTYTEPKGEDVQPNLQDYMPSGAKLPNNKREHIDMNLHMQSNNQWNQVSTHEEPPVITRKDDSAVKINPPTQYHTILKNTNASEFTLGAVMHTLTDQNKKENEPSFSMNEDPSSLVRPGLNVNERIANGKIVTVSMPLDVKEEREEVTGFQAPFQASSTVQGAQGWNILEQSQEPENATQAANATTFDFENFKPELIGGFKPIYNSPEEEENPGLRHTREER